MTWIPRTLRPAAATLLALGLLTSGPTAPTAAQSRAVPQAHVASARISTPLARVLTRVNAARARHDRKPLRLHACLTSKLAQPWAVHLADIEALVHRDPGTTFTLCKGFHAAGENIAYGYPTAAAVMKAWMHSPGHRRNILSRRYTRIGLGLAYSDQGVPYWVQNFAG